MQTYRVAEFARMGGVTVRALQYYDRLDLLKPSHVSDTGYRLYEATDLLQLQQIVTLKWMGFALSEIKQILDGDRYDLHKSLCIQQQAVDEKIARLQQASQALARAISATEAADVDELDGETIAAIIHGVTMPEQNAWTRHYFSDTAFAGIQARGLNFTPADQERAQAAWQAIFDAFGRHRHEAPDSPAVQAIAAQMNDLLEGFTGGDPEAWTGLERVYADKEKMPAAYRPVLDDEAGQLMQAALKIYKERGKS